MFELRTSIASATPYVHMYVQVLTEQLDSLFAQTTASHISEVWVCVFSAPAQDYALRVVKESKYKNVRLVVSDFNFKFYGRFQVSHSVTCLLRSTLLSLDRIGCVCVRVHSLFLQTDLKSTRYLVFFPLLILLGDFGSGRRKSILPLGSHRRTWWGLATHPSPASKLMANWKSFFPLLESKPLERKHCPSPVMSCFLPPIVTFS